MDQNITHLKKNLIYDVNFKALKKIKNDGEELAKYYELQCSCKNQIEN